MVNNLENKVLILGGSGMAGHMIKLYFESNGYDVKYTCRNKENTEAFYYDVAKDMEALEKILDDVKPNLVINAIGIHNKAAEDDHVLAVKVNSLFPHYVDSLSQKYGFTFIHMSTDCVNSGLKGQYIESDVPDASSFYGRSKALGEINNNVNLTIRTSIVGPDINSNGIGLFHWFMNQTGEVNGFTEVIWSGVTTLELAKGMKAAYEQKLTGLYFLVNNKTISKFDLISLFKKYMDKDIIINKYADKVENKSLLCTRNDFDYTVPSYEEMVKEMCEFIKEHKDIYKY